ncbi:DUF1904 family protein [Paenibacillus beijingensis]|uniref:DUF1904 domain-containing protein n=1 Tax=Paenibacillus beijingensis TaxID=1126833 RepID=A0A0D5NK06_9BACL|nr:DUF1904 family protein [Paenibacillus beijingensis]AJY75332.1 hypothetical protein VN24_13060 [Paenibacillus beijingensis]
MPQLTIRGIAPEQVIAISEAMVQQLADVCGCGTDNFTLDCLQTVSAMDGKRVDTYPFVEVAWFERGSQTRDLFAETIMKHFLTAGVREVEIAFKVYSQDGYYINGVRCDKL